MSDAWAIAQYYHVRSLKTLLSNPIIDGYSNLDSDQIKLKSELLSADPKICRQLQNEIRSSSTLSQLRTALKAHENTLTDDGKMIW